jgi:uncharacterized hydrophobic protein (TIGR00271 family)
MLHVRIISPPDVTSQLIDMLESHSGVLSLVLLPAAARRPSGDVVHFDLRNEVANRVMLQLHELGIPRYAAVAVESVEVAIADAGSGTVQHEARRREHEPVWDIVEAMIRQGASYPPSFFILLVIAGLIAAVGILTNSQILIVGAMVVGPEYGSIMFAALCITKRDWRSVGTTLLVLSVGFLVAIIVTFVFSVVVRNSTDVPAAYEHGVRPVSDLINNPNVFSVIVAVLAGIVGVVSMTEARANALIGVFISVTTIPAAADIGLSIAFQSWSEAWGSAVQLLLNVLVLIVVGAGVLSLQRYVWRDRSLVPV